MSIHQGRVVYLGYRSSYTHPVKIELDYTDASSTPQFYASTGFSPNPGKVFAIADFGSATAVRVLDATTNAVLAQKNGFSASCETCWPNEQMQNMALETTDYWVAWDPDAMVIVLMDSEVVTGGKKEPPHKKK